jgi:hypothetical protein
LRSCRQLKRSRFSRAAPAEERWALKGPPCEPGEPSMLECFLYSASLRSALRAEQCLEYPARTQAAGLERCWLQASETELSSPCAIPTLTHGRSNTPYVSRPPGQGRVHDATLRSCRQSSENRFSKEAPADERWALKGARSEPREPVGRDYSRYGASPGSALRVEQGLDHPAGTGTVGRPAWGRLQGTRRGTEVRDVCNGSERTGSVVCRGSSIFAHPLLFITAGDRHATGP